MSRRLAAGLAVLALLTGCSSEPDATVGCTAIGSRHGIGVTVTSDLAPINNLVIQVCVDDQCSHQRVDLQRGSASVDEGCTGDGPDAVCAASASPDGTQVGFVDAELLTGQVEVSGRYTAGGRTVELPATPVDVTTAYPNGPDCGADGTQGQVTLSTDGLS